MITRTQAIALFGSAVELAAALGYTSRHAVYMWPKDGAIPEGAFLKIRFQLKPGAFDAAGDLLPGAIEAPAKPAEQGASPSKKEAA
jgi:hypothetical protein